MTIDSQMQDLKSAMRAHRREILELLKRETPIKTALVLEQAGWPREWACQAVRQIEIEQNPAQVPYGPIENQRRRDRIQLRQACGGGLFVVCLLLTLGLFFGGRLSIGFTIGMFVGLGMWLKEIPELKRYPDRRLPVYTPPKELRGHNPGQY